MRQIMKNGKNLYAKIIKSKKTVSFKLISKSGKTSPVNLYWLQQAIHI